MDATTVLSCTRLDGVLVARMDDGRANAFSPDLIAAVDGAVTEAEEDPEIGALVLVGREGLFSAGFDLSIIRRGDPEEIAAMVNAGGALVRRLYGSSIPVVAACTGHAVAAGALVLLGSDVRVGAKGAFQIGLNEVAIGLVLPGWARAIARERLSRRAVQRSVVNARLVDPDGAVDAGFLDRVTNPEDVIDEAVREAMDLAAGLDPEAYRETVRLFRAETLAEMDSFV